LGRCGLRWLCCKFEGMSIRVMHKSVILVHSQNHQRLKNEKIAICTKWYFATNYLHMPGKLCLLHFHIHYWLKYLVVLIMHNILCEYLFSLTIAASLTLVSKQELVVHYCVLLKWFLKDVHQNYQIQNYQLFWRQCEGRLAMVRKTNTSHKIYALSELPK